MARIDTPEGPFDPSWMTGDQQAWAQLGQLIQGPRTPTDTPADFRALNGPAAIRFNNPGAQYPGPSAQRWGSTGTEVIGGGHQIAVFPDAVSGAAAQFDLLNSRYTGRTLQDAIRTWSGGNSSDQYTQSVSRETGLQPNAVLTSEMLADPRVGVPLARAMARMEAGRDYPLSDNQWTEAHGRVFQNGQNRQAPRGERPVNALDEYLAPQSGQMPTQTAIDPNAPKGPMGSGQVAEGQAPGGWTGYLQSPETRAMLISTGLQLMTGGWGNGVQQLGVALGKGAGAAQDTEAARLEQENKMADRGSREGVANAQIAGREQVSAARNETTLLRSAIASGARTNDEHKLWQKDVQQYLTTARQNVSNVGRADSEMMSEANEYARQQMERRRVTGGGGEGQGAQMAPAGPPSGVVTSVPPTAESSAGGGLPQWLRNMFPQPPDITGRIHPSLGRRGGSGQ